VVEISCYWGWFVDSPTFSTVLFEKSFAVATASNMKYSQAASFAVLLRAAQLVNGQTPPGSQPASQGDLVVTYNGTSAVERDGLLFPDRMTYASSTY